MQETTLMASSNSYPKQFGDSASLIGRNTIEIGDIFAKALMLGASDIHIEPEED
jgi:type II secretory ATPase GspE/PulE/Tfp pilus assembly ATPase PilB-like protein